MTNGTNHFMSVRAASKYYEPQEGTDSLTVVKQKIKEGLIFIGQPTIKQNEYLKIIDGRYHIQSN